MRSKLIIAISLILFLVVGVWMEKEEYFFHLKKIFQSREIPVSLMNYGPLGKIAKRGGFIYSIKNDYSLYSKSAKNIDDLNANIFQRKRQVGELLFRANPDRMKGFPSSKVIDKEYYQQGWPLISITIDQKDLFDPVTGITMNITGRGRDWERMGHVSYYEQEKLLFATGVGVRVHGRASRKLRQITSFRLYFRDEYGADQFKPGLLFGPESEPVKTLVVRKDAKFHSLFAYDVVTKIGADAPGYKAAILFVNGEVQGIYSLIEHLKKRQWESHFGNQQFLFKRFTSNSDQETNERFIKLWRWANRSPGKMNMDEVWKYVNLENMCRNILSYAFCGNYDSEQNALVLDKSIPGAKWYWINWDMDMAFAHYSPQFENAWNQFTYELIMNNDDFFPLFRKSKHVINRGSRIPIEISSRIPCLRSVLFYRLWKGDPDFHVYFSRLVMDVLNHRINGEFLISRIRFYDELAKSIEGVNFPSEYQAYMQHRPAVVRESTARYFGAGDSFICNVRGPQGLLCRIDDYPETLNYQGWYYKDTLITILAPDNRGFTYWLVNGRKFKSPHLSFKVTAAMDIELVTVAPK